MKIDLSMFISNIAMSPAALADLDTELTSLESRCDKTRTMKQRMMQELLTSRIRLVSTACPWPAIMFRKSGIGPTPRGMFLPILTWKSSKTP